MQKLSLLGTGNENIRLQLLVFYATHQLIKLVSLVMTVFEDIVTQDSFPITGKISSIYNRKCFVRAIIYLIPRKNYSSPNLAIPKSTFHFQKIAVLVTYDR